VAGLRPSCRRPPRRGAGAKRRQKGVGPTTPRAGGAAALGRLLVVYTARRRRTLPDTPEGPGHENGKSPALVVALPEAAHNDIVGWRCQPAAADFKLLMLHSATTPEARLRARTSPIC
jgi:hypothetical protein